ncbi:MAG: hypothetical protein B7X95_03305 [Methylophilaceae bacterium 17-44-8]|nr:MAG: hypothetical protein B7X95_03305 [Methylophilaceae bacterium 17-44-8]
MSKYIYKYVGISYLDKVFALPQHVTLKCGYPKDFNDPYELFLTINFRQKPGLLAFYSDVIGKLPQRPTTCFSRSPIVVPMWAHYAQDSQGFAIEFNEDALAKSFPESSFGDIDYKNTAGNELIDVLYRAYEIGKPRYLYMLQNGVFSAAYYTKAKCWSYELERRMIVPPKETRLDGSIVLMDVPKACVSALICGSRASEQTIRAVRNKADDLGCSYYDVKIGKTSPIPHLSSGTGEVFIFDGAAILQSSRYCASCKEPLKGRAKLCAWCQIEEFHQLNAEERNTFRMLSHAGILEEYIKGMNDITSGHRKNGT